LISNTGPAIEAKLLQVTYHCTSHLVFSLCR
jgi:hypothetical protein